MNKLRENLKSAFFKHDQINIDEKREVRRSSCIFYVVNNNLISTELHFLNYWQEKRGLSEIRLVMTFRKMNGDTIKKTEENITDIGAHVKSIKSLFNSLNIIEEEGSVEMEFFSNTDMFISYPAVVVRYLGNDWHTAAHSCQRIYSRDSGDREDLLSGTLLNAEEGNLTTSDPKSIPFFIMHNGPFEMPEQSVEYTITRENGESISFSQKHIKLNSYETILLKPSQVYNYKEFADGHRVSFTINFITTGIFPRLISGFEKEDRWSIDHTNFAAIEGVTAQDTFKSNNKTDFKNLVFNFPINPQWNNYVEFPPTYPKNNSYKITMNKLGKSGKNLESKEIICGRNSSEVFSPRFDFSHEACISNPEFLISNPNSLPKRFHMILNYQIGEGMPGFIVDGPIPYESPLLRTRWVPIFGVNSDSFVIISNRVVGDNKPTKIIFKAKLFNVNNDEPLCSEIIINPYENKIIRSSEIHKDASKYLGNDHGWLYLRSNELQSTNIHYVSLYSKNSIACDHAF